MASYGYMELVFLITGFVLGLLAMYLYMKLGDTDSAHSPRQQNTQKEKQDENELISEQAHSTSSGQAQEKEQNLERVMRLFDEHDPPSREASEGQGDIEITNDDVQEALGVSDATASRYLTELEERGEITQIGEEGRHVSYKKVT